MAASDHAVGHLGAPGCGKTYRMKARAAAAIRLGFCRDGTRFVVADVKGEWPVARSDGARSPLTSGTKIRMGRLTGRVPKPDAELPDLLICRPSRATSDLSVSTPEAVREWFGELCGFAIRRRRVVLIVPEVWRYAREHEKMVPQLEYLAHELRHVDVSLWVDAQNFAEVKKELLKPCGWWFLHGTGAHEDLTYLRKKGGPHLERATVRAMELNATRGPGHYVRFCTYRPIPPYVVSGPDGRELAGERFG